MHFKQPKPELVNDVMPCFGPKSLQMVHWSIVLLMGVGLTQTTVAVEPIFIDNVLQLQKVNNMLINKEKYLTVALTDSIDFGTEASKQYLPFGLDKTTQTCYPFSGTFIGNNFKLLSINLSMSGQENTGGNNCPAGGAGLFCGLENAVIKNIVFDSSCTFSGTVAGALSGCVGGNVTVVDLKSEATVTATQTAGGLFGLFKPTPQEQPAPSVNNVLLNGKTTCEANGGCFEIGEVVGNVTNVVCGNGTQNQPLWATLTGNQQNVFVVQQSGTQSQESGTGSPVLFDEQRQCFVEMAQASDAGEGSVCVDVLLNEVVAQQRWKNAWAADLSFISQVSLSFGQPISVTFETTVGRSLQEAVKSTSALADGEEVQNILKGLYVLVANRTGNGGLVQGGEVVGLDMVLVGDIGLLLCHNVSVVSGENETVVVVEHGQSLGSLSTLASLFADSCVKVHEGSADGAVVHGDMVVTQHMVLVVSHECVSSSSSSSSSSTSSPVSTSAWSSHSSSQALESSRTISQSSTASSHPSSSPSSKAEFVVIIFDGTVEWNETVEVEIIEALKNLTGQVVVIIDRTLDNDRLVQVVVQVPGGVDQDKLETIKNQGSSSGDCTAGVLCHATDAFIDHSYSKPSVAVVLPCTGWLVLAFALALHL